MEKIPVPKESVCPLEHIADEVAGLRVLMVNVFAIGTADHWMLVDAALPHSSMRIMEWIEDLFGRETRPSAVVLTHGHFDHSGALDDLLRHWDCPVFAHEQELPYLRGELLYPPANPSAGGGLFSLLSPLFPRSAMTRGAEVQMLPPDGSIPWFPEWRWVHTPGHTPGHVSLFREKDRILVAGDAFCTTQQESFLAVASQTPELHGPPAYYTPDWDSAKASVERLAALRPAVVAPGHGLPMKGIETVLEDLAVRFDHVARPDTDPKAQRSHTATAR